jgi:hypothetical protein
VRSFVLNVALCATLAERLFILRAAVGNLYYERESMLDVASVCVCLLGA